MAEDIQFTDEELKELGEFYDGTNKQDIDAIAYLVYKTKGKSLVNKPQEERKAVFLEFLKKYAALSPQERQKIILESKLFNISQKNSKSKKMLKEDEKMPGIISITTNSLPKQDKKGKIQSLFLDKDEYNDVIESFEDKNIRYTYKNINDFAQELKSGFAPNLIHTIKTDTEKPETIVAPSQSENSKYDFSSVIVIGDFDCKGYIQYPKSDDAIKSTLKILPLAVYGKLICSNWNHDLFYEIEQFPYAKSIDCSYSIGDLYDLYDVIQRLPTFDDKIVTSQIIIQPELMKVSYLKKVLKQAPQEDEHVALNDIAAFLKEHPDIQIVAAGDRNLMALIEVAKQEIENQNKPEGTVTEQKPGPASSTPTQNWEPSFVSLDKIMADLREEQADIDFSVLTDDDIQNAIRDGMNSKFIKTDENGRIIEIRTDGTSRLHTVVINAAKDKSKELEQSGSTQTQKDTGNNTNTTDEASETKSETHKRTIWLTKNVIDDLKKFKNKTHFDYIKWIQSLINPDTKIRTDKVWGTKNNATAFEIKTVANGGPRMYSAPYTATQMLIFSIGDKDTQKQKDIVNAKRVAKIYDKLNDELKPEHSTLPQITLSVQIGREKFTETLYNFDAAETRRDLGIEPKAKEEQSNTVITKQQVDQLSADGQNGAFQTVSYNDQKTTPKPKNRWQPVEELIQIYCEKHPDANKQEITEKVYAGCKELEDKEYLRKTDGGEYVVFDTDADGFIDLLLSGKSKEQHEPDVQQQDLDISGLKPKSAEEWAQSYLYSDGTPISTVFMELILEQVLPRNKPFAESIGFKEIKENDDDKYIIVDTESFTKFLYKQRERLVSLSMAARITFINKQALIDKCDTLEPDPKYFFYTGAYYDNIKYYFVRDNLHEFVATYFAPEDKIATRWSLEQLAKRMKTTKDKIMPVIRANADSELIQQCIIQDGFFAPMYLDAFKELYKTFYQNKANERKQKQQARILKAQEEEEKKYENVGMQQTLDELVDTFKDSESGKPKYTKSFMYLVLNTLMTDLYYRDLIEKHNFKDDIKYKKHLGPDKDSFTYTIGNIRSFERLLEKFAIRLIPIPQVAQQYGISQEALLEKCNSLGTNMAPDYGIPYFYKAPYFQGEEMYQFYMIKQNIHQFMQKHFSKNADKELWKIDQLAQYLAQYYPGVTVDIVKKINGGLHGAGATHGTWFTGHGVGRRFLAEYAGQYKSEYGAIIQQILHLDDSQIKSEADVEQPAEQPQQPTNTPVVDVAPTIVPEPEPTPEPQPTTFGGMLGVKTYQAKLNALMQLIEQKQQEKAMAENEMQSLDKEIEELNQQAIDKIKARDTTDSVGKLLEESKVKQHKLDQASARVKQLTYDIDSLQTRLEEGTKKLQQYNDAVNKKKAADQAAQQAADEVQMANNALQQFLQDF